MPDTTGRPSKFDFPTFNSVHEERQHLKVRLAAGFRLFGRFGFEEGVAGHITARDPEFPDTFWVNPFGMNFRQIRASDLIRVNHEGEVVEGDWPVNIAAFAIHSQVHQARPDIVAAAHSHSVYGKSLSALHGVPLLPLTQDACCFFNDQVRFDDFTGVVVATEEGSRIAAALGDKRLAILANHGLLTVGSSVDSAVWWYITAERSAQAQLAAMAAGTPTPIPDEVAAHTHGQVGSEIAGAVQFHPLFEWILSEHPDLAE